jgi:hypothetical protein
MFSDIKGFTSVSKLHPNQLAHVLGLYLEGSRVSSRETNGPLISIGDAIMSI